MITKLSSFFVQQIRHAEDERDRVYEPVIGIVTDNKDPEGLLRAKVRLPSISSVDSTWWIPIVSLGAGKERGWFFLPEVNDEVLVAFEHINRPVVIGALWNGKDEPLEEQSAATPRRVLVSRAGSSHRARRREEHDRHRRRPRKRRHRRCCCSRAGSARAAVRSSGSTSTSRRRRRCSNANASG